MEAPISASQGAMRSLPGKLEAFLSGPKHGLLAEEKNNYLLEPSEVESPAMTANFWMKDVRDLSYDIDDFLYELAQAGTSGSRISVAQTQKSLRIKISRFPEKLKRRQWIADEISGFRTRVKEAVQRHKSYLSDCTWWPSSIGGQLGERQHPAPSSYGQASIHLIGVDSSIRQLSGWLANNGQPESKVVSIVGTGGVGKTTLASEVYRKLGGQFECRAFVRTSRKPDMKRLLTSILSQVRRNQLPDSFEVHEMVFEINKYLQDKTYVIVIDDLWASSTWDIVNLGLPKGNCCSRILITTEVDAIAQTCCSGASNSKYIFRKEPLSEDESRELLVSTVFGFQAECPQGLKEVSNEIIKRSGGLPLTINILASLLARQPASSIEQWNYIKNALSSDLSTNASLEEVKQVIDLGYNNLPHGLKACMLYLCLYEEDCVIWKDDLVNQWMAEGFVCTMEGNAGKEVARSYFDELVNRGMIQPVDINCNDEILSCRVHRIVLHFIRYKSIEENFGIAIDHSQPIIRLADKVRRLALHFGNVENVTQAALASMRLSKVRSLSFSGLFNCMPSIVEFRFLQVLTLKLWADPDNRRRDNLIGSDGLSGNITEADDLTDNLAEPDDLSYNLTEISKLFRLRYFHLDACHMSVELPTQMQRLKDLVAWEIDAEVTAVPSDIVDLPGLLYLSIPSKAHLPTGIGRMTSLCTLGLIDLSKNSTENVMSLGELINLQELHFTCSTLQPDNLEMNLECLGSIIRKLSSLRCVTLEPAVSSHVNIQDDAGASRMSISWNGFTIYPLSPALQRLELSRRCCIFSSLPEWTNELTKLRILKIAVRKLSSEDVVILKGLPSLTALSVFVWTTPVRRIVFDNEGFSALKYFKFVCAAPCMVFLDGAMPKVRKLKLGFNANRMERCSLVAAGFEQLCGLNKISTKIGGASADECNRRSAHSLLTDAISKHPSTPIINVQWVDWIFCGDDEKYIEDQKEMRKQTLENQGVTSGESSDEHGIKENNLEEDAKKEADTRTYTTKEPTLHLQSTVHNILEEDKLEGPCPGDDKLGAERDAAVDEAVRVVEQWSLPAAGGRLVFELPEDAKEYLAAATCLVGVSGASTEAALQGAMARLEEEFCQLLIRGSAPFTAEDMHASLLPGLSPSVSTFSSASSVDNASEGDEPTDWSPLSDGEISYLISPDSISAFKDIVDAMHSLSYLIFPYTISALKDIADVMILAGHAQKLCQAYGEVRRYKLIDCLAMLGVDDMSREEVQRMEWRFLVEKIKKWIHALKVVTQGLLVAERRICSEIFAADADAEEECLAKAGKGCILQLLRFADNIASRKRLPENLFRSLDMYDAVADFLLKLDTLLSGDARDFVKQEAEQTLVRLGAAVCDTLAELVNLIREESSRRSTRGGEIHPMARYVMNYVVLLADYSHCLNHLLAGCETEKLENADMTPLGHLVVILITHLWDKMEDKSKSYDDEALQNIFLMNNLWYIVQKVDASEDLKTLLGDNWVRMHKRDSKHQLRTYAKEYLRSSWMRILACLRDDGLPQTTGSSSSSLEGAMMERLKNFNSAYEELYRTQTAWSIADPQLREELRISISEKLIPAYRSFVGRYKGQLEGLRNFAKYVKYSLEDLERQILDFFEGKSSSD